MTYLEEYAKVLNKYEENYKLLTTSKYVYKFNERNNCVEKIPLKIDKDGYILGLDYTISVEDLIKEVDTVYSITYEAAIEKAKETYRHSIKYWNKRITEFYENIERNNDYINECQTKLDELLKGRKDL